MHSYCGRTSALGSLLAAACVLGLIAGSALAHKLNVFASAAGRTIEGYAYFPGGGRAKEVSVQVLGRDGEVLGETTTDQNGEFTFEAAVRCDHTFVVDSGDGHRATYVVEADELPGDLPSPGSAAQDAGIAVGEGDATQGRQAESGTAPSLLPPPVGEGRGEGGSAAELDAEALSRQIRGLREQIEAYEERTRFRDVLGGIGYILGLSGVAAYFLARRNAGAARRR
jgi:nickel transport protein